MFVFSQSLLTVYMMRILTGIVWVVSVLATQAEEVDKSGHEVKIGSEISGHDGEHRNVLERRLAYKGKIDLFDSPVKLKSSFVCTSSASRMNEERLGDLYQLNLQANYCHTIKVNKLDDENSEGTYYGFGLALYNGIGPSLGNAFLMEKVGWYRVGPNAQMRVTPTANDRDSILSVYMTGFGGFQTCTGYKVEESYDYEIEIEREQCLPGEINYAGVIDAKDRVTTVDARMTCELPHPSGIQNKPQLWHLWRLNLSTQYCYTFKVNRQDCDMSPTMSLYKGVANRAVPGGSARQPGALTGANFLEWTMWGISETKYCGSDYRDPQGMHWGIYDPKLDINDLATHGSDGVFTLAIQYQPRSGGWVCDGSYEYELEVQPRPCDSGLLRGLRDTCSKDIECKSGLCTGRPGKTKKCRFCARKNEKCYVDDDCCQSESVPGRHCKNGQCKKRPQSSLPRMLAFNQFGNYFAIDTSTGEATSVVRLIPDRDYGRRWAAMDFDPTTGIMYGERDTELYRINVNTGSAIDKVPITDCSTGLTCYFKDMEFVNGTLYAVEGSYPVDSLVTIDKSTGALTAIGSMPIVPDEFPDELPSIALTLPLSRDIHSLAYDGSTMYGVVAYNHFTGRNSTHNPDMPERRISDPFLVTIDLEKAKITSTVLITKQDDFGYDPIETIQFGSEGVLYAASFQYGRLYSLDKATGVATKIGTTGGIPDQRPLADVRISGMMFVS